MSTLTDAVCIMMLMEDEHVSIAALAQYILNNQNPQIDAILEQRDLDLLHFTTDKQNQTRWSRDGQSLQNPNNAGYTLRQFLSNDTYKALVQKIVEFNGGDNLIIENSITNIALLDKVLQHEKVVEYLIA